MPLNPTTSDPHTRRDMRSLDDCLDETHRLLDGVVACIEAGDLHGADQMRAVAVGILWTTWLPHDDAHDVADALIERRLARQGQTVTSSPSGEQASG